MHPSSGPPDPETDLRVGMAPAEVACLPEGCASRKGLSECRQKPFLGIRCIGKYAGPFATPRGASLTHGMRKIALGIGSAALLLSIVGFAAAGNPNGHGQPGAPNNTCGPDNPVTPGGSANAGGSPFNPNGTAGGVYAGNPGTDSLEHSNSNKSVSQYDAACVQLSH